MLSRTIIATNVLHCRIYGYLLLGLPQAEAKLKNNVQINNKCLIKKRQPEQLFLDDQMFIVSRSRPNFWQCNVGCSLFKSWTQ